MASQPFVKLDQQAYRVSRSGSGRELALVATGHSQRRIARWLFAVLIAAVAVFASSKLFAQAAAPAPAAAAAPAPQGMLNEKMNPQLLGRQVVLQMEQARKEGISKADFSDKWEKFAAFEAYYRKYVMGKFKDAEFLGELGALTQSILEDNERAARVGAPAAPYINRYILEIAAGVSMKNYHPAARVNATLLLALLDDAPENPSDKKPPTPSAAALRPLVQLYSTETMPDGVRAAALYGITRHVSLGAVKNPQQQAFIVKAMKELLQAPSAPGRSPAAHAYLQRYAVDVLSVLANPNSSADTTNTLVAISTKTENPNLIAAYAASKMGVLQPNKQKVNQPSQVLKVWAGRAADAVDAELKRIAELDKPLPVSQQPTMPRDDKAMANNGMAGMSGSEMGSMSGYTESAGMGSMSGYDESMMSSGMMGMGMGMGMVPAAKPQPPEVLASRRRINYVLQQFLMGATGKPDVVENPKPAGLLTTVTDADKASADQWIKTVGEVVGKLNDEMLDDRKKFVTALTEQSKLLRELSGVVVDEAEQPNMAAAGAAAMNDALGVDPLAADPLAADPLAPAAPVNPAVANPAAVVPPAAPNVGAAMPPVVPDAVAPAPAAPVAPAPVAPAVPAPVAPAAAVPGVVPPAAPAQ